MGESATVRMARLLARALAGVMVAVLAGVVAGTLAGCARTPKSQAAPMTSSARPTPTATPSVSETPSTTERDIAEQLVAQLSAQCTALSSYFADPANWHFTSAEKGQLPFEMMINLVDDRTIFIFATPYPSGEVKITPTPNSAALAFSTFTDMGCSPAPGAPKSGSSQTGGGASVTLPDFSGQTENDVDSWFTQNGRSISVEYDYGYDSNPDCEDSGDGEVIGQNPASGEVLSNDSHSHVVIEIDCSW